MTVVIGSMRTRADVRPRSLSRVGPPGSVVPIGRAPGSRRRASSPGGDVDGAESVGGGCAHDRDASRASSSGAQLAAYTGTAQPVRSTCSSSPTSTSSSPPSSTHRDGRVAAAQHVRDRGAAGARARRQRLPHAALEDPRADAVRRELGPERHVGAVREARRRARCRPDLGQRLERQVGLGSAAGSRTAGCRRSRAGSEHRRSISRRPGPRSRARPMSTRQVVSDGSSGGSPRRRSGSRTVSGRSSRARRRYRIASRAPLPESSASEPSGLKIRSDATKPGSSVRLSSSTPSAPGPECGSQSRRTRSRRQLERQRVALDDQVVVAQGLPLLEAHGRYPTQLARDIVRLAPGHVDQLGAGQLAHPRQLALGVVARPALHGLDVALRAARRSRAPAGRSARRPRRARRAPPRSRPRRPSRRRARRSARTTPRAP